MRRVQRLSFGFRIALDTQTEYLRLALGGGEHHNRILVRYQCIFQLMIVRFELLDGITTFISMMKAARGLETLKQVHFCLTSSILVCGHLSFNSFSNEVLVTRITRV